MLVNIDVYMYISGMRNGRADTNSLGISNLKIYRQLVG